MTTCWRTDHYAHSQDIPVPLTLDPRLHAANGTPCQMREPRHSPVRQPRAIVTTVVEMKRRVSNIDRTMSALRRERQKFCESIYAAFQMRGT